MNIENLRSNLKLIEKQLEEYTEVKRVAIGVLKGELSPNHELYKCTVEMTDVIISNLKKEHEEKYNMLKSLELRASNGGYPFGN